ncbi:MAG: hypothetical protein IIC10_04580 [Proteobacteria bacterium]|nr:hypothetical protein [Pseudomonadota bacterium]
MNQQSIKDFLLRNSLLLLSASIFSLAAAQENSESAISSLIVGNWVINEELSDNTDDRVEAAIKEAGGKVRRRWFKKRAEDFYRGGPAEQELYDRISYDDVLRISYDEPEFRFEYADNYVRVFHIDGRRRSSAANDFYNSGSQDFSFGNFDGDSLLVEARPRDDGFTLETYTLQAGGDQLVVKMQIQPNSFGAAILLTRVYDRAD